MAIAKQKSVNVSNPQKSERRISERKDARAVRTRARIDAAFGELLLRRAYGDIRVGDITRKAGVGRATFYAHYSKKDDLLRSQFERGIAPMLVTSPDDPSLLDATRLFEHIAGDSHIYNSLMGRNGGTAPRVLRDGFENRVRKVLALEPGFRPDLKQATLARFVASSLLTITECWLEHGGRETPQHVQALFANLVSPGLRALRKTAGGRVPGI